MNIDEFEATQNGGQPDASIEDLDFSAEPETAQEPETKELETETEESEEQAPETEEEDSKPEKKVQTPEENAKFAEERRQRQAEERAKAELEKLKASDPAFQTAKILEEMYGMPIAQIQERINQARIQQIAEKQNVPVEHIQQIETEQKKAADAQQELIRTQFQLWETRVQTESVELKKQYPMLSDDDLQAASQYMLDTVRNPDIPLAQAVFALHGAKITESLKQAAKNEALAEISGRKQSALPPQGSKATPTETLTDAERYVAKQMGLTEEEYLKWR
jgi:hypothetical protein